VSPCSWWLLKRTRQGKHDTLHAACSHAPIEHLLTRTTATSCGSSLIYIATAASGTASAIIHQPGCYLMAAIGVADVQHACEAVVLWRLLLGGGEAHAHLHRLPGRQADKRAQLSRRPCGPPASEADHEVTTSQGAMLQVIPTGSCNVCNLTVYTCTGVRVGLEGRRSDGRAQHASS
jgi:hypothetical protein